MTEPAPARLARSSSHSRRGSHRVLSKAGRFLSSWWAEILIGLLLAFGIFLLFERMQIRQTLFRWLRQGWSALFGLLGGAASGLAQFIQSRTLSDLTGLLLLAGAAGLVAWRVRWRFLNSPRYTDRMCPRCGGSLHRVHRHALDRALNAFVPVRRYRCDNRTCAWHGLRFGKGHHG